MPRFRCPTSRSRDRLAHAVALALAATFASTTAQADGLNQANVQPPELKAPERGSIAGTLAKFALGPEQLVRGSASLSLPLELPTDQVAPLIDLAPGYSSGGGFTEWGVGWSLDLSIERFRETGHVDYETDRFRSPWGPLLAGDDGAYYLHGVSRPWRFVFQTGEDAWVVTTDAGVEYRFDERVQADAGTYAWFLSEATGLFGTTTRVAYQQNTSGRLYPNEITYGPPEQPDGVRIRFARRPLVVPFVDHRSGHPLELDELIERVDIDVRGPDDGAYRPRASYALKHAASTLGPAQYLVSLQRSFAAGAVEPAHRYRYDTGELWIDETDRRPLPDVTAYAETYSAFGLTGNLVTLVDVDEDGQVDVEFAEDHQLITRRDGEWVSEVLPERSPETDALCRPFEDWQNRPRSLLRLNPEHESDVQVLVRQYSSTRDQTELRICDRAGQVLDSIDLDGAWDEGYGARVVDLNRDHRPDLIATGPMGYRVVENTSNEAGFSFVVHDFRYWSGDANGVSGEYLFHDFNGDSIVDAALMGSDAIGINFGLGNFEFSGDVQWFSLEEEDGWPFYGLSFYQPSFVDLNRDGLTDIILSGYGWSGLFYNRGDRFVWRDIDALGYMPWDVSLPIASDWAGTGDQELAFWVEGQVQSVALTRPSTGLLQQADDGKGTRVGFHYERAAPTPGIVTRPALLARVDIESQGRGRWQSQYRYEAPITHGRGRHLLGFERIRQQSPGLVTDSEFSLPENHPPLPIATTSRLAPIGDGDPSELFGGQKFSRTAFEASQFRGVTRFRSIESESGWRDGRQTVSARSLTLGFDGLCPVDIETRSAEGTARRSIELHRPSYLPQGLPCLPELERLTGRHENAWLDFELAQDIQRDDYGRVTEVAILGEGAPWVQQRVFYNEQGRVESIDSPGKGVLEAQYHPASGLLQRVYSPDGTVVEAGDFHPVLQRFQSLTVDRGGAKSTSHFRFDAFERLATTWNPLDGTSEQMPTEVVEYRFATATTLGEIRASTLVDPARGNYATARQWLGGDGETLAEGLEIPQGFSVANLKRSELALLATQGYARPPIAATDADDGLTLDELLEGAQKVSDARADGWEQTLASTALAQGDRIVGGHATPAQQTSLATRRSLRAGALVSATTENGQRTTEVGVNSAGNTVWSTDAAGNTTRFHYDIAGRIRAVTMPSGIEQRVTLDGYGRPTAVDRTDVGTIAYDYAPVTGLLEKRTVVGTSGADAAEVTRYAHDDIGRVVERVHERSGESVTYRFEHDGVNTGEKGQLGFVTGVEGPLYARKDHYRPDGKLDHTVVSLDDWAEVEVDSDYFADGKTRSVHRVIRLTGADAPLDDSFIEYQHDDYGRLSAIYRNGALIVGPLEYDGRGKLARVGLADGNRLDFFHDPTTLARSGYELDTGLTTTGFGWALNDRGLVDREAISRDGSAFIRTYGYDDRAFLTNSFDTDEATRYEYDQDGLVQRIVDREGERSIDRLGPTPASRRSYVFDDRQRLVERDATSYQYRPDGELGRAYRGNDEFSFAYDEEGQRVLKLKNGQVEAAYVGSLFISEDRVVEPVKVGGLLVGVIVGDQFEPILADPRGTPLFDDDGARNWATPYGLRDRRAELAAALDFVEKGYDADLELVRMGRRDYDPYLAQFVTPDPMLLEELDKCAENPVDCNLYSYAKNNPISYVDPTGLLSWHEVPAYLSDVADGFMGAAVESAADAVNSIMNPIDTVKGMASALVTISRDPAAFAEAVFGHYRAEYEAIMSGDGQAMGRALFELVSSVGGGGGVLKLLKAGKFAKLGKMLRKSRGGCNCFVAGTLVQTEYGLVPIEEVREGDLVWSRNDETGEEGFQVVMFAFASDERRVVELRLTSETGGEDRIEATPEHPFWARGKGWVGAAELVAGDQVYSQSGGWLRLSSSTWAQESAVTYNLTIQGTHTYFVGQNRAWVHNTCPIGTSAGRGSATKRRVTLRKSTMDEIIKNQPRNAAGQMIDPNTKQPLIPGKIDVGHKPGKEWRRRKKMHEKRGSTREQVIEAENNSKLYQLEDRSSNRSHRHERKN